MKNVAKRIIVNAQQWLNLSYPLEIRKQITKLKLYKRNLTGELVIRDFVKLREVDCCINQLTALTINNCPQLEKIVANRNKLTSLTIDNCPRISHLYAYDNKINQDLTFLKDLVNLKELELGDNPIYGSLEPLKNLSKLETLYIRGTDISHGLEYLPESLWWLWCIYTKLDEELWPYGEENGGAIKSWREVYKRDQQIKELKTENQQLKELLTQYQKQWLESQIQIPPK